MVRPTVLIAGLLLLLITDASSKHGGQSDARKAQFTDKMKHFMADQKLHLVSVAVIEAGHIVYKHDLIQNNIQNESESVEIDPLDQPGHVVQPNGISLRHAHSIVPAMDVNHLITSLGIMTLSRDGLLNLYQKVFAKGGLLYNEAQVVGDTCNDDIRLINLIQQSLGWGIRDMRWSEILPGTKKDWSYEPLAVIMDRLLVERMMWTPGAAYNFSVVNDYFLRKIVAKYSGQDYETYITDKVLTPLKLHHTKLTETATMKEYSMPLLSALWTTNVHDLVQLLMATKVDRDILGVDLSLLYSRPELPYPQGTRHWHSPTYVVSKQGEYWGEAVTSNGHYQFIYRTGRNDKKSEIMLVLYAKGLTHRHFKPILVKMLNDIWA